jgi:hypothetical protein
MGLAVSVAFAPARVVMWEIVPTDPLDAGVAAVDPGRCCVRPRRAPRQQVDPTALSTNSGTTPIGGLETEAWYQFTN